MQCAYHNKPTWDAQRLFLDGSGLYIADQPQIVCPFIVPCLRNSCADQARSQNSKRPRLLFTFTTISECFNRPDWRQ